MNSFGLLQIRKESEMKLSEIRDILRANIVVGDERLEVEVTHGAASDLMRDLLTGQTNGVVVLSGLNNLQVIRTSVIAGVSAVVIVRGKHPDEAMIAHAGKHGLPLMTTPFTMFTACGRLCARGIRGVEQKIPR
jgi:predicted transcriptional regulator